MRNTALVIILTLISNIGYAQITITNVAKPKMDNSEKHYDSTLNFLGKNVYQYIGQYLYLKIKPKGYQYAGYRGFYKFYNLKNVDDTFNIVDCCYSGLGQFGKYYSSKYAKLAGKYFKVLAVYKNPNPDIYESLSKDKIYYLKLKEKENGNIIYYRYDSKSANKYIFPFIVVGYLKKQKQEKVEKKFIFANKVLESSHDIETGKPIKNIPNQRWECTDITLIEGKYKYNLSLVIKDSRGQKTTVPLASSYGGMFMKNRIYTLKEAETYEKRFGKGNWLKILDGKIAIGFTKQMVKLSWGSPERINKASYGDQWVYVGQYLYFKNDRLVSYN